MNLRIENLFSPVHMHTTASDTRLGAKPDSAPAPLPLLKPGNGTSSQILYNGECLKSLIRQAARTQPDLLAHLSGELKRLKDRLQNKPLKNTGSHPFTFTHAVDPDTMISLCEMYLGLIAEKLKARYERTQSGLDVEVDEDGQLILNGINVTLLILKCQRHLTSASRVYLKGIGLRLNLLMGNSGHRSVQDKLFDIISTHQMAINTLLSHSPEPAEYAAF